MAIFAWVLEIKIMVFVRREKDKSCLVSIGKSFIAVPSIELDL